LLTAIFDPNAAIKPRYQAQTPKLKFGAEHTSLMSPKRPMTSPSICPGALGNPRSAVTSPRRNPRGTRSCPKASMRPFRRKLSQA
jgi:hypothetical protein